MEGCRDLGFRVYLHGCVKLHRGMKGFGLECAASILTQCMSLLCPRRLAQATNERTCEHPAALRTLSVELQTRTKQLAEELCQAQGESCTRFLLGTQGVASTPV